ncbi:MAG: DUF4389 domain-containing protein [Hyphomicrobiales bacterium]
MSDPQEPGGNDAPPGWPGDAPLPGMAGGIERRAAGQREAHASESEPAPGPAANPPAGVDPPAQESPAPGPTGEPPGPPAEDAAPARWEPPARPPGERYPMRFEVEYPERLSRWKTLLRAFLLLPVYLFFAPVAYLVQGVIALGWIPVFLKRKYPSWLFAMGSGGLEFTARYAAYALLLTDRYPSFDRDTSPVRLEYDQPPNGRLSRWRVLFWKLILLVPHFVVLFFLGLAVWAVTIIAWFAILFTGRYPRGMFGFVTGVMRWYYRVIGYFASYNDRFPPFALSGDAGPGERASAIACGVIGLLLVGGCTGGITAAAILVDYSHTTRVDYDDLAEGIPSTTFSTGARSDPTFTVRLEHVTDPADDLLNIVEPDGRRVIVFDWRVYNGTSATRTFEAPNATLVYEDDGDRESVDAMFVLLNDGDWPAQLHPERAGIVRAAFVVPADAEPVELRLDPPWPSPDNIKYRFE